MDFGLREILFFIGLIFIVGILIDGLRRMRKSRGDLFGLPPDYDQIDVGTNGPDLSDRDQVKDLTEVVDLSSIDQQGKMVVDIADHGKLNPAVANPSITMEPSRSARGVTEPELNLSEEPQYNEELPNGGARKVIEAGSTATTTPANHSPVRQGRIEPEMGDGFDLDMDDHDELDDATGLSERQDESGYGEDDTLGMDASVEDVIVFNIVAKNKGTFSGQTLLKAAEMCHLELGEMNIFHRYEKGGNVREPNKKLFSMANLVEPGTFDLETMHDFKSPGVCLFMRLPGPIRSIAALERMVDTARKLATKLGAEMRDEHHSVITPQTIEHYRQRVMEFERKRRTRRHAEMSY